MCKRILTAALALLLCAGCASAPDSETEMPTTDPNSSVTNGTTGEASKEPAFPETVLVDNEDIFFQISSIHNDPVWGYTLKAQIENRTDKDMMFALSDTSVNGYMCDPLFAVTVTAGMKANKDISFSIDSFRQIGIQDVTDVEFTLRVYDSNDWTADSVVNEIFTIYPLGPDAVKEYPRQSQDGDIVLFDDENCTMIITGFEPDSVWGYSAHVYLVNKTDATLMFSVGDASINGYMCSPYFAQTVAPGKQRITSISWSKNALDENGISQVEKITMPIRVYDANDWMKDDLVSDTFTVNP